MSKYTILDDFKADEIIEVELNFIKNEILKACGHNVLSIYLVGGFGRGEGGVILENGKYRPINDYDIIVLVKKKEISPDKKRELENNINNNVSVKQVDIAYLKWYKFLQPSTSISRYEINKGHIPLYERFKIPIFYIPPNYIPLIEGLKYFRTRGGGLLISRLLLNGFGEIKIDNRKELIFLELNKIAILLGDIELIKYRKYNYSYLKRSKIWFELKLDKIFDKKITNLYLDAINYKLKPYKINYSLEELNFMWNKLATLFIQKFLEFENYRLNRHYHSILDYVENEINNNSMNKIKQIYNKEYNNYSKINLFKTLLLINCYLINSLENNNKIFKAFFSDTDNLDYLTKKFLNSWHPNGIISHL
jgi:hypothetical protein